jgi:hypothetical protein
MQYLNFLDAIYYTYHPDKKVSDLEIIIPSPNFAPFASLRESLLIRFDLNSGENFSLRANIFPGALLPDNQFLNL